MDTKQKSLKGKYAIMHFKVSSSSQDSPHYVTMSNLDNELKQWANGNDNAYNHWKKELESYPHFINVCKYAEQKNAFTQILNSVSIGLKVRLRSSLV